MQTNRWNFSAFRFDLNDITCDCYTNICANDIFYKITYLLRIATKAIKMTIGNSIKFNVILIKNIIKNIKNKENTINDISFSIFIIS